MERFPVLTKADLDETQCKLWDELTLGPRGFYTGGAEAKRLPDLYNAWLQFPEFGELMIKFGDVLRTKTQLPGRFRELIVLTTSAMLGARVEFDFHVPFAQNEGLSEVLIEAIRAGEVPPFADDLERVVFEANVQLLRTAMLTDGTREEAIALLGYRGVTELIATVTLYVVTAYTTNVARVKLADDFSADPGKLKDFFAGKTA
ncbi:carboxymuconolactone decarboxylase family protein [Novosphingobium sp. G106]|uniref:carboxymuconolactone decarboxylase family protein n=1 Tax=Novosphingobium sp. G106 TaxID=2849500 RepID=UPI001C2DBA5F|nr:carboxymuconolactone decarboxylase family protein [Novosphingobium sp. G106]MBV1691248.1 carboxymuconolactone decarboxylase family protein [Novosphingobium sp. G106]